LQFGNQDAYVMAVKGTVMKTNLMRTLIVALLATSIPAFAKSDDRKHEDATAAATEQVSCKPNANDRDQQDVIKSDVKKSDDGQKIEQQDKDWLHAEQGVYGG
jgi:Protein of unknown function (DUF2746)